MDEPWRSGIVKIDCQTLALALGMPEDWRIQGAAWSIDSDTISLRVSGPDLPATTRPALCVINPILKLTQRFELDWQRE